MSPSRDGTTVTEPAVCTNEESSGTLFLDGATRESLFETPKAAVRAFFEHRMHREVDVPIDRAAVGTRDGVVVLVANDDVFHVKDVNGRWFVSLVEVCGDSFRR